ncbi:MAG: hypothetical protein AAF799_41175 [Myxococcota bacterium]
MLDIEEVNLLQYADAPDDDEAIIDWDDEAIIDWDDEAIIDWDDEAIIDWDDESAERRRRGRGRRSRRGPARGRGYTRPRASSRRSASQRDVQLALGRVAKDIRKNASFARSVDRRVTALGRKTAKELKKIQDELQNNQQMALLTTMLSSGKKTYDIVSSDEDNKQIVLDEVEDKFSQLLPLLANNKGGKGLSDNPMMLMLMLDAFK